jgi:uncharacterized membrane protein YfcA
MLLVAIFVLAVAAGGTAAVVGFGIGSLLTPLLALEFGTVAAVAAVAFPHAIATALRLWRLRRAVDRTVLLRFGALSAAGGLGGSLLFAQLGSRALTIVLGVLLVLTAVAGITGWAQRWHPSGVAPWLLGVVSGFSGGIVGNQGGVRAAALLSFRLTPAAFVATSTGIALLVDAVRTPIYVHRAGTTLLSLWPVLGVAAAGTVVGTLLGERVLLGMGPERFRRIVSAIIGVVGVVLVLSAVMGRAR